jgi:adenosylcobinamide kinase/adenosylcobinamide-phosphate guanylyltransferase
MLWIVTGGIGSGKSAFAEAWAAAHGREAIKLACPPWPGACGAGEEGEAAGSANRGRRTLLPADRALAERLNRINLLSNPFRASDRVVIVDSLSGWLRQAVEEIRSVSPEETEETFRLRTAKLEAALREVVGALLGFEGRLLVVTEDTPGGLARDPWERWYLRELSSANRRLSDACDGLHHLVAGVATELKSPRKKLKN